MQRRWQAFEHAASSPQWALQSPSVVPKQPCTSPLLEYVGLICAKLATGVTSSDPTIAARFRKSPVATKTSQMGPVWRKAVPITGSGSQTMGTHMSATGSGVAVAGGLMAQPAFPGSGNTRCVPTLTLCAIDDLR